MLVNAIPKQKNKILYTLRLTDRIITFSLTHIVISYILYKVYVTNFLKNKGSGTLQFKKITNPSQNEDTYRHELKYQIDACQVELLKCRLPDVVAADSHAGANSSYEVRSMYFDDFWNSCYYDNEDGNDPREKFRIRIYNGSDKKISLELKRKQCGKTLKKSCPITREQVEQLIVGQPLAWDDNAPALMKKFIMWLETRYAQPKIIVNYDRIPFVYPDGNVRITLDTNIMASTCLDRFFCEDVLGRPIMPLGQHLLEVKFDEFIPDHIFHTIQTNKLTKTTFSKYYLCRKFGGIL